MCTTDYFLEPIIFLALAMLILFGGKVASLFRKAETEVEESGREGWFWEHDRGYEEWCKNIPAEKPPPRFFFAYQSDNKIFAKYVMSGVIGRTWKHAALSMCIAGLIEWAIFYIVCREPNDLGREVVEKLLTADNVFGTTRRLVTFLVAIYVNGRMKKHAQITDACWAFRGSLINITVKLGSFLDNGSEAIIRWKYDCYRYLVYMHFLVYKAINPEELSAFDLPFWVNKNLLTQYEAGKLKGAKLPFETVLGWLMAHTTKFSMGKIMMQDASNPLINYYRAHLVKDCLFARGKASFLIDTCSWLPPISQAQLLTVCVEFFLLICPMSIVVQNVIIKGQNQPIYIWSMVGAGFFSLFFAGLLNLVRIVENPFGDDLDDLNEDALLVKTEQQMQIFLLAEVNDPDAEEEPEAAGPKSDPMAEAEKEHLSQYLAGLNTKTPAMLNELIGSNQSCAKRSGEAAAFVDDREWRTDMRAAAQAALGAC